MKLPTLHLTKQKANSDLFRSYLKQALEEYFGFSHSLKEVLEVDQLERLSDFEVKFYLKKYLGDLPKYFYFFEDEQRGSDSNSPLLYTDIISLSFDNEGLLVLERFNNQIYDLRGFQGAFIDGSCHDLILSIEGRYMMRSSENQPGFFEYRLNKKGNYFHYNLYCDLDFFVSDFLEITQRDRIQLATGQANLKTIENFTAPKNKLEAKAIIESNCNYICSPLLRVFYHDDEELALLALRQDPLIFTLISKRLQQDPSILRVLCLHTKCRLTPYFLTYKINPYAFLNEQQIIELIHKQRLNFHAFSVYTEPSKAILEAAAQFDKQFLEYLEKFKKPAQTPISETEDKPDLPFGIELAIQEAEDKEEAVLFSEPDPLEAKRNYTYFHDPHLMLLLAKQHDHILNIAPKQLLEDETWIEAVLICNLNTLCYAPVSIKNNASLLMRILQNPETFQDLKIYHAHEDRTLQRFSELFLTPEFKLILLEKLPAQPIDDGLPF